MFERVTKLFRRPPWPAEMEAKESVRVHLVRGTRDPDTQQIIAAVAEAQGEQIWDIRREILDKQDDLLERLEPLLESWQRSDSLLREAMERRELYRPDTETLKLLTYLTLAVAGVVLAAFFIGGLPTSFLPWNLPSDASDIHFEMPEFGIWIVGAFIAAVIYQPLRFLLATLEAHERTLKIPELENAWETAKKRFDLAAANLAAVSIRKTINERLGSFSTDFRLLDHRGLRALADPEREVSTAASDELSNLMASLSSGSIGLSGPRGVGKTTLIESFARGRSVPLERERIGLVVSAPVKYDAKEFVLHLFASLCERVIGAERLEHLQSRDRVSAHDRRRAQLIGVFALATLLVAAVGAAMLIFDQTAPEGPRETAYVFLAIGALMAFGWIELISRSSIDWDGLGLRWLSPLGSHRYAPLGPSERKASRVLERIRFQQSISSSLSGSARLPLGLSIGGESSVTTARVPWSLPEAVEEFRKYAASLTDDNYLVIGIDELDKMGSDASAREFLNNVKGVFGVSGCYYLVSVSDDAMASFERRGMPVRDVFDSSFDAVQRIDYLTLKESRTVIESRVIGLPVPYQCLCHCLAGGLPRDLIRVTRELVHQALANELASMDELARAVVGAELRAKTAGAIEKSRESIGAGNELIQKWLDGQGGAVADPNSLRDSVSRLDAWAKLDVPLEADLAFEVATFDYYAATVLELFRDDPELVDFLRANPERDEIDSFAIEVLETLTKARQQFAIGPGLAWERIVEAREALNLEVWDDPRQAERIHF